MLSDIFRDRLDNLLAAEAKGTAQFLKDTGIDRSALSQFRDPHHVRLPRAETLRNIAAARGVSVDWLLGLENAPEGRQSLTSSFHVESEEKDGQTPLEAWRIEVEGQKIRYVPSLLPDMLNIALQNDKSDHETEFLHPTTENILGGKIPEDMDVEISMPVQTLYDLAQKRGFWKGASTDYCKRQLEYMARICDATYPTLRLHVYDGNLNYSSSFTIFGKTRVAIYVGEAYLVLTGQDEIRAFVQRFDDLVRNAIISPDRVGYFLEELSSQM